MKHLTLALTLVFLSPAAHGMAITARQLGRPMFRQVTYVPARYTASIHTTQQQIEQKKAEIAALDKLALEHRGAACTFLALAALSAPLAFVGFGATVIDHNPVLGLTVMIAGTFGAIVCPLAILARIESSIH